VFQEGEIASADMNEDASVLAVAAKDTYVSYSPFCADWHSVVMPVRLHWLLNFTSNFMTLFVLVLHVLKTAFGFIFIN